MKRAVYIHPISPGTDMNGERTGTPTEAVFLFFWRARGISLRNVNYLSSVNGRNPLTDWLRPLTHIQLRGASSSGKRPWNQHRRRRRWRRRRKERKIRREREKEENRKEEERRRERRWGRRETRRRHTYLAKAVQRFAIAIGVRSYK